MIATVAGVDRRRARAFEVARRKVLIAFSLGTLSAALPSLAQQPDRRVRRIGFLSGQSIERYAHRLALFREGMAELRWVDGRDYLIDARFGSGSPFRRTFSCAPTG